jgi:hypothetical protein
VSGGSLKPPPRPYLYRPASGDRGQRRGINCAHDPHYCRAFRVTAHEPADSSGPRQP